MSNLETHLHEAREFEPPAGWGRGACPSSPTAYADLVAKAEQDPQTFWAEAAAEMVWAEPWKKNLDWKPPHAQWFVGGKLNASYNCVDRHLATQGDKNAVVWESEQGHRVVWTYRDLHERVCNIANVLQNELHLRAGDSVAIYMPLCPEAIAAMLACARIGVIHTVVFAGFSATALRDRLLDANCKAVLAADITWRRGKTLDLQSIVWRAIDGAPNVEKVMILRRTQLDALPPRFVDWRELCRRQPLLHECSFFDSEQKLFYLYTSGTTGKPKGIVHTTGGYLTAVRRTFRWVFDLHDDDVYWCTADIGWITGHSYLVYGPLANGATCLIFEGAFNYPDCATMWSFVERNRATILYTSPTALRACMSADAAQFNGKDLSRLRLLGSVGESISPEVWMWYREKVGRGLCPIIDTWWQTETGSILLSPLPSVTKTKPGSATKPFPGICLDVVDEEGKTCPPNQGGYLVIKKPWPSMLRGIHGDEARFRQSYFSKFEGIYFTGDGAHRDQDGYFWIHGRIDDVINVSGHRLGTMEIESALLTHPQVAEAAIVGKSDEIKGQSIVAFVVPKGDALPDLTQLKAHVASEIGGLARPDQIYLTRLLPKTRSGKIMRRLLRDFAEGKAASGDTSTLETAGVVELIES